MECYVGLDVHSKASVFVIQEKCGRVIARGEMPTTPAGFQRWQEAQRLGAGTPVALESGTVAFFVARELTALGLAPSAIDAHEVRLKAHRCATARTSTSANSTSRRPLRAHDHPALPAEAGGRGAAVGTAGTGGDHCAPHSSAST
jgi:hypothetical protein